MVLNIQGNLTEPTTTIGRFGLEEKDPTIDIGLPEDLYEKVENYVNPEETDVSQQTDKILKPKPRPPNLNTIPNIKPKLRPGSVSPIEKVAELNYLLRGKIDPKSRLSKILSGLNELTEEGQRAIKGFMDNAVGGETDFDPTKDAWCAAFVAHILSELGADPLKSKNRYDRLRADKYKEYGSAVENFADAREGDIVVFDLFGNDGVGDHVAFYAGGRITDKSPIDSAYINVVGGNQGVGEVSLNENVYTKDKVLAIRRITYNDIDFEFTQEMAERDLVFKKFIPTDASDLIKKGERFSLDKGGMPEQMNMFGYTAEGVQQEVDKFVDKDAAPAKDITFKDAAKFVAELTPIIGDAMAAKEVYDELQKEDPNYFLAGALGGAAIIGLIPGIGDAAASAIRAGARKAFDVGKRVEVDPDAVGMMGGNIRLKSKKTLDDFGYIEDNPVTKGYGGSEDWLSGKIKQANKSKNLLDGATTALLGTSKDKPLFLDTDFISSLKGARDEVRKKGEPQYDRLKKTVDKEGFDPNKTILIEVNHKGEAYIVEGNTRAALAKELDIPNIKAEIRYKNGAELVDSPFSPQNILEKSSTGSYQDALAISKKFDFDAEMAALDKAEDAVTWQKNAKAVVKKRGIDLDDKKSPEALELQESTRLLLENKITRDQHLETVDRLKPVKGYDQLPREPSDKALAFALDIGKRTKGLFVLDNKTASKLGVNTSSLKVGDLFNSRLDIPAYLYHDTWIVAGTSPAVKTADNKSVTTYAKAVHFGGDGKPVRFIASQNQSERIGTGVDNKIGYATVSGIVKDLDADAIRAKAAELLDDPEWTQVGFDPRRQGGFYVRAGENKHVPVREASEVIQIGPLVLAKNAKLDMDYTGYNEGGLAVEDQMQMAFMNEGGVVDKDYGVADLSDDRVVEKLEGWLNSSGWTREVAEKALAGEVVNQQALTRLTKPSTQELAKAAGIDENSEEYKKLSNMYNTGTFNQRDIRDWNKIMKSDDPYKATQIATRQVIESGAYDKNPRDKGREEFSSSLYNSVTPAPKGQMGITSVNRPTGKGRDNYQDHLMTPGGRRLTQIVDAGNDKITRQNQLERFGYNLSPEEVSKESYLNPYMEKDIYYGIDWNPNTLEFDMGYKKSFNEGGMAMHEQMQMAFMNEGGIIDDDMDVDPVSGNEVPPGSLAEEVRDDIPAQLSEGEYVVPADVVRYYGVKFFEDLRERAKIGLAEMEANGRIGGEPVPDGGPKMGDSPLSPEEQAAVNSILGMAEGGTVQNPYLQQQQMYTQPAPQAVGNAKGFSGGGLQPPVEQDDDLPTMTEAELTTPTVYNDANYSFLSDSPKVEEAFTPVLMIDPDTMTEQLATTKEMYDQLIKQGYIPKKDYNAGQADTTTTPTTTDGSGGSGGGSGGSTTVTPKGGGFKNWGDDIDWSDPDAITQFVKDSQEGMIDPKTGKKLAQVGLAVGGPGLGTVGGVVGTVSQMGAISDMRAAAIIARAQGNDSLAATIEGQVEQVLKNSSGLTRLMDKFFKGMMDGDAKAKAKMDKLGLKYDPDNITEYSSEQIAANQLALKQEYETKSGVNKKKAIKSFDSKKYQEDQGKKKSKASDMLKDIQKNKNKFINKSKQTGNPVTDAANKAQTEKNLKDVTNKLKNAQQTGNFSLNKGGLMTKGKKKK